MWQPIVDRVDYFTGEMLRSLYYLSQMIFINEFSATTLSVLPRRKCVLLTRDFRDIYVEYSYNILQHFINIWIFCNNSFMYRNIRYIGKYESNFLWIFSVSWTISRKADLKGRQDKINLLFKHNNKLY